MWGFGLFALGTRLVGSGVASERLWLRWQRLTILASVHYDGSDAPTWKIGGIDRARRLVAAGPTVRLDQPLLAHERSAGIRGGYARPSRLYGLVKPAPGGRGVMLTPAGDRLASATANALGRRDASLGPWLRRDAVDLEECGLSFPPPSEQQCRHLATALRRADRHYGRRLAGLWPLLDDLVPSRPEQLDPRELFDPDQRAAAEAAADVADLVKQVETAFRENEPDWLDPALATHPAFDRAAAAGYDPEYTPVQAALAAGGPAALEALWRVHEDRYPATGRWSRLEQQPSWAKTVPDFGLDAAVGLYEQGVEL